MVLIVMGQAIMIIKLMVILVVTLTLMAWKISTMIMKRNTNNNDNIIANTSEKLKYLIFMIFFSVNVFYDNNKQDDNNINIKSEKNTPVHQIIIKKNRSHEEEKEKEGKEKK